MAGTTLSTLRELVVRTYRQFRDDDALTFASALAFHVILALFPFLLFLVALLSYLELPGVFAEVTGWADRTLPEQGARQIEGVVAEIAQRRRGGLLSIGLGGAVWAASGGIRAVMRVLNQAYDVEQGRPLWRRIALSLAYTIGLAAMVLVAGMLLFVGPQLVERAADLVRLDGFAVGAWRWLRFPIAVALLLAVCSVTYTVLPRIERFRLITPGSMLAVAAWLLASWALRLYVEHFGRFGAVYGSVGAFVVLLLYAWVGAIILLVGAELNAVLRSRRTPDGSSP